MEKKERMSPAFKVSHGIAETDRIVYKIETIAGITLKPDFFFKKKRSITYH